MSENNEIAETGKEDEKVLDKDIPVRRDVEDNTSVVDKEMFEEKEDEAEATDDKLQLLFDGSSVPLLDSSDGELDTDPETNVEYEADSENSDEFVVETDSEDMETIADVEAYHRRIDENLGGAIEDWKDRVVGEINDEKHKLTGITPIHEWEDSQTVAANIVEGIEEVGHEVKDDPQDLPDNDGSEKLVTTVDEENASESNEIIMFYHYAQTASPTLRLRETIDKLEEIIKNEEESQPTEPDKANAEKVGEETAEEVENKSNEGNDTIDLIDLNDKTPNNTVEISNEGTPEPIMSSSLLDETLSDDEEPYEKGIVFYPKTIEMNAVLELVVEKYKREMAKVDETETRPLTILVEGNIGSGKTTLLKQFEESKNVMVITEPVHKWRDLKGDNLLQRMYEDPKKWSFVFQTYVQLTMLEQHTDRCDEEVKIMERSLYSARYCFVENLFKTGKMEASEYEVIKAWFEFLTSRMHDVDLGADLVIYLRTSPEKAMERIQQRSRGEEDLIPMSHVRDLHQLYEEWLVEAKHPRPGPVVVLDANENLEETVAEFLAQETLIFNKNEEEVDTDHQEEEVDTDHQEERIVRYIDTD